MDLFPIDWRQTELEHSFEITCYGKLRTGQSVCLHVPFTPYFFVECPPTWSQSRAKIFIAECVSQMGALHRYSLPVTRKSIWGFTNHQPKLMVQLAFPTLAALRRARKIISEKHRLQTYEASVDQVLRLFHLRNLKPAQWIRVNGASVLYDDERTARTDVELSAAFTSLEPSESTDIPPVVFASWDIECYSASGSFPLAEKTGDCIITICTAFQKYGEPEPYLQHCVTLKGCLECRPASREGRRLVGMEHVGLRL